MRNNHFVVLVSVVAVVAGFYLFAAETNTLSSLLSQNSSVPRYFASIQENELQGGWNPRISASEWHKPSKVPGYPLVQFGNCLPFCDRSKLKAMIPEFLRWYSARPHKNNVCGMAIHHQFATFAIARFVNPEIVIENGVNAGGSSYILRQACPKAHIYHIDPLAKPICDPTMIRWRDTSVATYFTGKNFTDFANVDWQAEGIPKASTLVLFDTHVNDFQSTLTAAKAGFGWAFYDDNFPAHQIGDMGGNSVKQILARNDHRAFQLYNHMEMYFEMPPLISPLVMTDGSLREFPMGAPPIENPNAFDEADPINSFTRPLFDLRDSADAVLFRKMYDLAPSSSEWWWYTHMAVAKLRQPD